MTVFSFTSSGKVNPPSDEELLKADEETAILAYTNGKLADGRPYYAYIAVKPSKYHEFYTKSAARQTIVLGDYGTIVAGGFEAEAPADVVQLMRDRGFDENYEQKIVEEAKKQQAVFMDKQETERLQNIVAMLKKKQSS